MNTEIIFRILLAAVFAAFVAHRGYYTRKYGQAGRETLERREDTPIQRLVNLLALPGLAAAILYAAYPAWVAWASLPFPAGLRWLGVGIALAGFALLQWAHQALGKNWSDTPRLMEEQFVVMDGPYRWIRHPIYTAFLLILGSTLLISANWVVGLPWIVVTAFETISRIRFEEALLTQTFGEQYRDYVERTGRLMPRWKGSGNR
jgi:protein-S-isoprenylcysteine O-methyltransferase Ste14